MGTTNYESTFIEVAADCPVDEAQVPQPGAKTPSVAELQHRIIAEHPYDFTSDDVLFEVYAIRNAIPASERAGARAAFFAKSQACLRASPLGKRYGWGVHSDADGRVALVPVGSDRYRELAEDSSVKHLRAMRSKRV
ncbi:hypothetical protein G7067_03095 [Leucobacter insecticola]|uniref:Uncharacterized protein n=1 Tax=Leucobacter insecticola TaxID=2714934 RepID=A0A6G8FGN8_9MICO|nr:DUF6157 family protein [Leucobacter insecticola]QIM15630.1 hypothetical protein G7067_03095 [Leucobacter insecticola]